jgi:hypothetical protein
MASIKKRILILSNGRQIKLEGHCICISNTLEIGEGFTRSILRYEEAPKDAGGTGSVANPNHLTADELMEISDYIIGLWMQLKDKIRSHGVNSADIFKRSP